jgi:hypothetical protein
VYDNFEKAYRQVMEQVEAPTESINLLLPRLNASFEAGLPVKQMRYLEQYLPDGQWRCLSLNGNCRKCASVNMKEL